ncbi:MAG: hypothetical protein JSW51_11190 [Gemmatimonadota bacterium]|nr:MAG: hypothetical protein JSW51_11190 [Gemmatimonadota bacterium]
MKSANLMLIISISVSTTALGQEQTLVTGSVESGGMGAPVVKLTQVADEFSVMLGGRGGWIINHTFLIGAGGYGLANDVDMDGIPPRRDIEFGYGGLELEYINSSNSMIHFTVQGLIGGGGITTRMQYIYESEAVFVMEGGANLMLNITPYFRIGIGGGYRWVTDVDIRILSSAAMSAPYFAMTFKFGKF